MPVLAILALIGGAIYYYEADLSAIAESHAVLAPDHRRPPRKYRAQRRGLPALCRPPIRSTWASRPMAR